MMLLAVCCLNISFFLVNLYVLVLHEFHESLLFVQMLGCAEIHLSLNHQRAHLTRLRYHYPLKVFVPIFDAKQTPTAAVYLGSYGGGLLDGDRTHIQIHVDRECNLVALSQASTKVYKQRKGRTTAGPPTTAISNHDIRSSETTMTTATTACHCLKMTTMAAQETTDTTAKSGARQTLEAHVAAGGFLCWVPETVVAFADANYEQDQRIYLDIQRNAFSQWASLVLLDWYTSGRKSRGEQWQFERFVTRNQIYLREQQCETDGNDGSHDRHPQPRPPPQHHHHHHNGQHSKQEETLLCDHLVLDRRHQLSDSMFSYHRSPYHVYATVILVGPQVQATVNRLLEQSMHSKLMPVRSPFTTSPEFLWSISSCDLHGVQCDGSCWHCMRAFSRSTECSVGGVLKMAAKEVDTIRKFLNEQVFCELPEVLGENLFQRML